MRPRVGAVHRGGDLDARARRATKVEAGEEPGDDGRRREAFAQPAPARAALERPSLSGESEHVGAVAACTGAEGDLGELRLADAHEQLPAAPGHGEPAGPSG